MSIARLTFPSRLELNRLEGSFNAAPFANVILTTFLYVSPVQTMPPWDQTGIPGFVGFTHFHSSTTSGSASLMIPRTLLSVLPRQSPSSLILLSTSLEAFVSLGAIWYPLGECRGARDARVGSAPTASASGGRARRTRSPRRSRPPRRSPDARGGWPCARRPTRPGSRPRSGSRRPARRSRSSRRSRPRSASRRGLPRRIRASPVYLPAKARGDASADERLVQQEHVERHDHRGHGAGDRCREAPVHELAHHVAPAREQHERDQR